MDQKSEVVNSQVFSLPMEEIRNGVLFGAWSLVLGNLLMLWLHYPAMGSDIRLPFLVGRLVLLVLGTGLALAALWRKGLRFLPRVLLALVVLSAAHGHWYWPGYELPYLIAIMAYPVLFRVPLKVLLMDLALSFLVFLLTILWSKSWERNDATAVDFRRDAVLAAMVVNVIAVWVSRTVMFDHARREALYRRFADVGRYSAVLIHDVKGMIGTVSLYAQQLRSIPDPQEGEQALQKRQARVDRLNDELKHLADFVKSASRVMVGNEDELEWVEVSDAVLLATGLMRQTLKGIRFSFSGSSEIYASRTVLVRILMNLLINSVEILRERSVLQPEIWVRVEGNQIVVEDNGGGFLREVLGSLNATGFPGGVTVAPGMGCLLVRDYMELMQGKVTFTNGFENQQPKGAKVILEFPSNQVRSGL